jgi:hypothetical protein
MPTIKIIRQKFANSSRMMDFANMGQDVSFCIFTKPQQLTIEKKIVIFQPLINIKHFPKMEIWLNQKSIKNSLKCYKTSALIFFLRRYMLNKVRKDSVRIVGGHF